jgi:hypothetical protein
MIHSQNDPKHKYIQTLIEGKWHVVATNFPMWLDGKSKDPSFNYSNFRVKNDKLEFDDKVIYTKDGSAKELKGKDTQKKAGELLFSWRGKGLLGLFKSNWRVIASDREGRWIAIHSSKTLVSPEGVDILAKNKNLSEKEIRDIITHLDKSYIRTPIEVLK